MSAQGNFPAFLPHAAPMGHLLRLDKLMVERGDPQNLEVSIRGESTNIGAGPSLWAGA